MKFLNVFTQLWCEPWMILPEMHKTMCNIVWEHYTGAAHDPEGISAFFDMDLDAGSSLNVEDGIATIEISGPIMKGVHPIMRSSGVADVNAIRTMVDEAEGREDVQGILYEINSPGGAVTGTPELASAMAAGSKPSVVYTDELMASAAYWLGASADKIVASRSASVGSIGVYMAWLDVSRNYEMQGIKTELIKAGKFKATGVTGVALTDGQRELLQDSVDKVYGWFTDFVTEYRDARQEAMEGQVFYAEDALNENLIDAVGDRSSAVNELRRMV